MHFVEGTQWTNCIEHITLNDYLMNVNALVAKRQVHVFHCDYHGGLRMEIPKQLDHLSKLNYLARDISGCVKSRYTKTCYPLWSVITVTS